MHMLVSEKFAGPFPRWRHCHGDIPASKIVITSLSANVSNRPCCKLSIWRGLSPQSLPHMTDLGKSSNAHRWGDSWRATVFFVTEVSKLCLVWNANLQICWCLWAFTFHDRHPPVTFMCSDRWLTQLTPRETDSRIVASIRSLEKAPHGLIVGIKSMSFHAFQGCIHDLSRPKLCHPIKYSKL